MSALTDWLFDKTPDIADEAPPSRFQDGRPTISDDEEWLEPPEDSYALEEVLTVIDYRDARGNVSRRRITLRKLARGPHAPILSAICHERRAFRQFRCDRIDGFIDFDTGEVQDCPTFFREVMLIDLAGLAPTVRRAASQVETALSRARAIRDELRAPISVLVGIARSDELFQPEELDTICAFAEKFSPTIHVPAHPGEISAMGELRRLIQSMRPTRSAMQGYMNEVRAACLDAAFRDAFLTAVGDVIMADGRISPGEHALLTELGLVAEEEE